MKKNYIILLALLILVLVILGLGVYKFNFTNDDVYTENSKQINSHDGTYLIEGQKVILKNGISETEAAPGSASKIITRYFGNDVKHDLNNDGREDTVFILTQSTGGSGVFFYVVALLNTPTGNIGSQALFLGDRIAPQTITIDEGITANGTNRQNVIVVNYAVRQPSEPFTTPPSVGKSIWIKLYPATMQFGEVAQNFEGEADTSKMTLGMKTWDWISTTYSDGAIIKPKINNKFTLTFKNDKTFSATTDCNSMGGEYTIAGNQLSFGKMFSTQMYCENSQESDFTKMLNETQGYFFTQKGELVFNFKFDSGSFIFK